MGEAMGQAFDRLEHPVRNPFIFSNIFVVYISLYYIVVNIIDISWSFEMMIVL